MGVYCNAGTFFSTDKMTKPNQTADILKNVTAARAAAHGFMFKDASCRSRVTRCARRRSGSTASPTRSATATTPIARGISRPRAAGALSERTDRASSRSCRATARSTTSSSKRASGSSSAAPSSSRKRASATAHGLWVDVQIDGHPRAVAVMAEVGEQGGLQPLAGARVPAGSGPGVSSARSSTSDGSSASSSSSRWSSAARRPGVAVSTSRHERGPRPTTRRTLDRHGRSNRGRTPAQRELKPLAAAGTIGVEGG